MTQKHFQEVTPFHDCIQEVVREVVVMGGTLIIPGNVTPVGGSLPYSLN